MSLMGSAWNTTPRMATDNSMITSMSFGCGMSADRSDLRPCRSFSECLNSQYIPEGVLQELSPDVSRGADLGTSRVHTAGAICVPENITIHRAAHHTRRN